MRLGCLAVVLAGCGFRVAVGQNDGALDSPNDDVHVDVARIDGPPAVACSAPDTSDLIVCYELEDDVTDGVLADSAPGHHDATTTGLTATTRTVPTASQAALASPTSSTYAPQIHDLDRADAFTLALWIRPTALPADGKAQGILDHEGQYAIALVKTVAVALQNRCILTGTGTAYEWTENLPVAQWSLLACSWDGQLLCASRWSTVSDHERYCSAQPAPATTGTQGLAIGGLSSSGVQHDRYQGAFDSVQVYARALTADQLCALAGQPAGCLPCIAGC